MRLTWEKRGYHDGGESFYYYIEFFEGWWASLEHRHHQWHLHFSLHKDDDRILALFPGKGSEPPLRYAALILDECVNELSEKLKLVAEDCQILNADVDEEISCPWRGRHER